MGKIVFDVDFKNYKDASFNSMYLHPNTGVPLFMRRNTDTTVVYLDSNGLYVSAYTSDYPFFIQSVLFPHGSTGKIRIYQKETGAATQSGLWSRVGLFRSGYTNTYTDNRGMGAVVSSDVSTLATASFKNGHSANWGFTESGEPGSSMLIVPQQRLYPIQGLTLESEIIYDLDSKSISYKINGVDAFEATEVPDDIFYAELREATKFYIGSDGNRVYLERCTIELL